MRDVITDTRPPPPKPQPAVADAAAGIIRQTSLIPLLVMVFVVAVGALLRFYDLTNRGLIYWDEAKFALEGERMEAYLRAMTGSSVSLALGKTIGTAKPTHGLLIAAGYLIFGIHDYVGLIVNAVAGLAGVALAYFLGRRLFGPWAGVIGASFLAVSEYDIIYSRSALSEVDASTLLLGAVLLLVVDWERTWGAAEGSKGLPSRFLVLSALVGGLAFTANYRMVVYIGTMLIFDLAWSWREHGRRPVLMRALAWAGGLIVFPLGWQIVDFVARAQGHVLFRAEVTSPSSGLFCPGAEAGRPQWYLSQAIFQLHCGKQGALHFDPFIYLQWFVLRQGWIITLLVLVGLFFTFQARDIAWAALAALIFAPFIVYSFASFIVPRNLAATMPYVSLLAAGALVAMAEKVPGDILRRAFLIAMGLGITAVGARMSWHLRHERSGFSQAAVYLHHIYARSLSSNEIMVFYLPGPPVGTACDAPPVPYFKNKLAADRRAGYTYVVLDQSSTPAQRYITGHASVVRRYPAFGVMSIGENPISTENGNAPDPSATETVTLYDISKLRLPSSAGQRTDVCRRNVPI